MLEKTDPFYYKRVKFCLCDHCTEGSEELQRYKSNYSTDSQSSVDSLLNGAGEALVPTVSWDTVPIEGVSNDESGYDSDPHNLDYALDRFYDSDDSHDDIRHGRGSSRNHLGITPTLTDRVRGSSPMRPRQNNDFTFQLDVGGSNNNPKIFFGPNGEIRRRDYPSRPVLFNNALIRTQYHKDWKREWRQRVEKMEDRKETDVSTYFKFPEILFPKVKVDLTDAPLVNDNGEMIEKERRASIKRHLKVVRTPVGLVKTPRTILVHISGREHTWVALDWAMAELAEDIDYIVIIANIPRRDWSTRRGSYTRSRSASRSRSRSRSRMRSVSRTREFGTDDDQPDATWCDGYTVGEVNDLLQRLIEYSTLIMSGKKLKITVEIVIGSTSQILIDSLNAYAPDFFVIGSSIDKDGSGSVVVHKSRHLAPVLMQYFPIPVFFVAARRMGWFEKKLQRDILFKQRGLPSDNNANLNASSISVSTTESDHTENEDIEDIDDDDDDDDDDDGDDVETTSNLSLGNREKTVRQIQKLRHNYRRLVDKKLKLLDEDTELPTPEKYYGKMDSIINATLNFNKELETWGDSADMAEIKRSITGGVRPRVMKKKSMLDFSDVPPKRKSKIPTEHENSKETMAFNQNTFKNKELPKVVLSSPPPSRSVSPLANNGAGGIKFANTVKSKDGKGAIQRIKSYDPYSQSSDPFDRGDSALSLNAVRSHQPKSDSTTLRKVLSATSLDKKESKKGRLLSFLFGGSSNNNTGSNSSNSSPVVSESNSRRGSIASQSSSDSAKKRRSIFGLKK